MHGGWLKNFFPSPNTERAELHAESSPEAVRIVPDRAQDPTMTATGLGHAQGIIWAKLDRALKPSLKLFFVILAVSALSAGFVYAFGDLFRPYRFRDWLTAVVPLKKHDDTEFEAPFFRKLNLRSKTQRLTTCSWSEGQPLYLPDENDELEQIVITWMNAMNLTYSLFAGSLLGAYRHQGKIPDENGMDILLPVPLNFGCDAPDNPTPNAGKKQQKQQKQQQQQGKNNATKAAGTVVPASAVSSRPSVCHEPILDGVVREFERRIADTRAPFTVSRHLWRGIRLTRARGRVIDRELHVDILVMDGNSYWMEQFVKPTCKCWFRSIFAQCVADPIAALMEYSKQTKEQLLTPSTQAKEGRAGRKDRSKKNPFHPKWRLKVKVKN